MDTTTIAASLDQQLLSAVGNLVPLAFSGDFLQWAILFFVIAIVAAIAGASGVAGISMTIAKWFVIIFLILAVISLLL